MVIARSLRPGGIAGRRPPGTRLKRSLLVVSLISLIAVGCTSSGDSDTLVIYTTVTQDTVDAVVDGFIRRQPEADIEVFRAPTGEVTARIAAEMREGGLKADVLWLTDPLSMQQYDRDGILRQWNPDGAEAVPADFKTDTFFGTRLLNLVIVASSELASPPTDWADLATVAGGVAIPDPGFAGSAFGALGFFALNPEYGIEFYAALHGNGTTQVQTPGEVVAGVAEGVYAAGITLDRTARNAVDDGSPVTLVWPASGAIAIYSPIGVVDESSTVLAEDFVEYALSEEAQALIAGTGWEPVVDTGNWPDSGGRQTVDWSDAFDQQESLLDAYNAIFG
jgi:iron(III) transport system substrate-binding protein